MHWYSTLTNKKNLMLRDYLDLVRGSILSMDNDAENAAEGRINIFSIRYDIN